MSEHCMIDGERCSECCKVLTLRDSPEWRKWAKENPKEVTYNHHRQQCQLVYGMITPISRRRAKKINPYLVSKIPKDKSKSGVSYFLCKNYIKGKCSIYNDRPDMCRDYPRYDYSEGVFKTTKPDYKEDCTYFINLE